MEVILSKCDVKQRRVLAQVIASYCEELEILSNDPDKKVRMFIGENLATPVEILRKLANDSEIDVRYAVENNPNTPADLFVKFADDEALAIRMIAAKDQRTPEEGLWILIHKRDFSVNSYLAQNPNLTPEMEHEIQSNFVCAWEKTSWEENLKKRTLA